MPETITLSTEALRLLRCRLAGEWVEVTEETRPLYRELVSAGLMEPLHTFALGPNSAYRPTEASLRYVNGQSTHSPSSEATPSPRG